MNEKAYPAMPQQQQMQQQYHQMHNQPVQGMQAPPPSYSQVYNPIMTMQAPLMQQQQQQPSKFIKIPFSVTTEVELFNL